MTQKAIFNLPIGAGQYTEQSERGAVGRWYSMDKVRFRKGLAEKIGGWAKVEPQFVGICRRLLDWSSLDAKRWTAVATDTKLYLWQDGTLFDITPLRRVIEPVNGGLGPFETFTGETRVRVTDANHGVQLGDYMEFTNAIVGAASGLSFNGEYTVDTIIDPSHYEITNAGTAATGGANEGGTAVRAEYQISIGAETAITATGYGTGPYGREGYGNARTGSTLVLPIRTWSLDTWGEDLLCNPRGGQMYWWDRSKGTGTRATPFGGDAPPKNEAMIVSQRDRHVIALGAYDFFNEKFDPLLIRWCSTEDLNDWVPTSTNTSGDLRLYSGSKIVTGVRSRLETVVFTDVSVHTMPFFGGFDVFGLNTVGENVSILGPNAAVPIDARVIFMAESDFYLYDGIVKVLPCDVRNWVYDNINVDQRDKVYGGLNREFNEVWFFYPSFDPLAYVQQPFDLRLPVGYSLAVASGEGIIGYEYEFNSSGFTTLTNSADNGYEYDYILTNDEPILTPTECEWAVELAFEAGQAASRWSGMVFLRTEITGTQNTTADDAQGIYIEADIFTDTIRVRKKNASGVKSVLDNDPGTYTFTAVSGSAAVAETKYNLTAQFDTPTLTLWLDSVQVWQIDLSAAELLLYTGGSAGLHMEPAVTAENSIRFYNFAAGPVGVLTAQDFDISPIEVNRYVMFNYEEGTWATGMLGRTAWADRSPQFEKAYAARADGYLYEHETGTDADGVAMETYIESFDMEIPNAGEELMHVDQLIPDFLTLEGDVAVSLTGRKYPSADRITKGPYTVDSETRKVSTRMRARQVAIKISSSDTGDKWRMGNWRGRAGPHGKRG
jgi:hypothetical protein